MSDSPSFFISNFPDKSISKRFQSHLSLLGSLPLAVILIDKDNIIRYINSRVPHIFELEPGDLIDMPINKVFTRTGAFRGKATSGDSVANQSGKSFFHRQINKKGEITGMAVTSGLYEPQGFAPFTQIFIQVLPGDKNEVDAASLKQKIDDIQLMANSGYWESDKKLVRFKGDERFFKLLGIKSSSAYIKFPEMLSALPRKEDRENLEKGLISLANSTSLFFAEIKIKKLDKKGYGNRTLVFIAKWSGGKVEGKYTGIIQDVTESKKIEKVLHKGKLKAERSDRLKSHFLTNLSHEIRTPMNAIMGFAELLNLEELTKDQKREYTKIIRTKGNNLLSMIDDGIELSKFETGNIAINKTEFKLYPMLKELFDEYEIKRNQLSKSNISLELKVNDSDFNDHIYTDEGRLQQLLSNLLSNALKFTEKGEIEFGYRKSGKFFKFYVKDTGIGIKEDEQSPIFNRFHEIEETITWKYGGSGLNLTISKHIVNLLGGKIKLKSEINKGSRFQISIPIESPKIKKLNMSEYEEISSVNLKDKVILIAEDEEVNFRFLEAVLQKTQSQILHAKTGSEAVELCKNISQIDLVLMDIKMPEMNGFDATREIKKRRPSLVVIAQTAFTTEEELNKCYECGCDDILTKPIDIKQMMLKISDLLII